MSKAIKCEVCTKYVKGSSACDHPKNAYCALFLKQAAQDAKEFKMQPSKNPNKK